MFKLEDRPKREPIQAVPSGVILTQHGGCAVLRRNFCGRRQQERRLHRRLRNTTEITRWKAAKVEGIPLSSWSVFRRQDGACLHPKPRIGVTGVTGVTGGGSSGALGRGACTEKVRTQHGRLQGFVRSGRETTPARYSRCRASLRV